MPFFCQNGALIVVDMCVKFGVQQKSGSLDIGQKGVKKKLFWEFLENGSNDFVNFQSERGSYGTLCVNKVWSPEKIWFSRYGAIGDPEKALSTVS